MADVFRTQTCVMVTSPGSGTSHPNMLPLGQRRGINGKEEEKGRRWQREKRWRKCKVNSSARLFQLAERSGFRAKTVPE